MLVGPLYLMRFRKATEIDKQTAAALRRAGVEADIDDDARSQVRTKCPVVLQQCLCDAEDNTFA
jgi:hypothetical protein